MADGEQAGIPQTADCMNCHQSSDGSKAAFRSLFEHAEAKKQILWTRVYLLPYFVFFGHSAHQKRQGWMRNLSRPGCHARRALEGTRDFDESVCGLPQSESGFGLMHVLP